MLSAVLKARSLNRVHDAWHDDDICNTKIHLVERTPDHFLAMKLKVFFDTIELVDTDRLCLMKRRRNLAECLFEIRLF